MKETSPCRASTVSRCIGWWGKGEVKFFLDGDGEFPTIATTGLEYYFCGSYNFDPSAKPDQGLVTYTTPYAGFHQVIRPTSDYRTQFRMGMYRFHVMDPIRFERDPQGDRPGARLGI